MRLEVHSGFGISGASRMNVVQSNISTTIRSFNISDDIRIEVKKFRTDAGIDEIDIEEDEDDICKKRAYDV